MARWYYSAEGHATGPVSEQELGELATKGVVCTETLIWQPEMEEWEPVWKLKPQIIERLNKSAMAKQAKGSTDRIPESAKPVVLHPPETQPALPLPAVAQPPAPTVEKSAPPEKRSNPQPAAPVDEPKPGLLQRIFGRKKK